MSGALKQAKPLRSLLFAPGNHARRREKAFQVGADGVILDLEDAVPAAEKVQTRPAVRESVLARPADGGWLFVRINGLDTDLALADLETVVVAGLDGVMLPKTESATDVRIVDWLLAQFEREAGLDVGRIEIYPILETATGLLAAREIGAASTRVKRLGFGVADFTLDTGMEWSAANPFLQAAAGSLVVLSRACGLEPPLDTIHPDLRDLHGLRAEALQAKRLGFQGKTCIHPDQVGIVNEVFTPSAAEVEDAREVYDAFRAAESAGSAAIQVRGRFVDYPIAERARRTLELAVGAGVLPADYAEPEPAPRREK
jgi:citrate lyase subunit beta / citryl-CoA lyase